MSRKKKKFSVKSFEDNNIVVEENSRSRSPLSMFLVKNGKLIFAISFLFSITIFIIAFYLVVVNLEGNADDATYHRIYEGEWLSDAPYSVIHRIAVKYHGRGIIDFCFEECFKRFPSIRIDTHEDNIPMQKCLSRCGFKYCGIIYLADGAKRLAYQKID